MEQFNAKPKKWGSSLGIIIPNEIVQQAHIKPKQEFTVLLMPAAPNPLIKKIFGTLKLKKPTQQVMKEIDEGYDEH